MTTARLHPQSWLFIKVGGGGLREANRIDDEPWVKMTQASCHMPSWDPQPAQEDSRWLNGGYKYKNYAFKGAPTASRL